MKQWFQFLREVCSGNLLRNNNFMMGGPGHIVELDESAIERKCKYNRGYTRGSGIKWIFGLLDINSGKCHLEYVPERSRETLFPIIRRHVAPNTEIHSEEAAVYITLNQEGYIHKTVKHKDYYVNPVDGTHTNNIENFWKHLKTKMRQMNGVCVEQLALHLDEYIYRWNFKNTDIFDQLLLNISMQYIV